MPAFNTSRILRRLARRRRVLIALSITASQEKTKRAYTKRATRKLLLWQEHAESLSDSVFKRAYRLDRDSFGSLLE